MKNAVLAVAAGMVVMGSTAVFAQGMVKEWTVVPKESSVKFQLKSTIHTVPGDATVLSGSITQNEGSMTGQVIFPVADLKTYHASRDKNMYKMFEVAKFPQIIYQISSVEFTKEGETSKVNGTLTIHGVTLDFPLIVKVEQKDGALLLVGEASVSIKSFGMKAPGVLGIIRVADQVDLTFSIVLR